MGEIPQNPGSMKDFQDVHPELDQHTQRRGYETQLGAWRRVLHLANRGIDMHSVPLPELEATLERRLSEDSFAAMVEATFGSKDGEDPLLADSTAELWTDSLHPGVALPPLDRAPADRDDLASLS